MAVEFALFGLGSQKSDALLAARAKSGSVELDFEAGGKKYTVQRNLKRGKSVTQDSGSVVSDGTREDLSASELKPRILQILNFNEPASPRSASRIYRYAVFTPQEEMKSVLQDKETRLETLRRAFGIEDFKTAADNASEISRGMSHKMKELEMGFRDLDALQEQLRGNEEEKARTESGLAAQRSNIESAESRRNAIRTELQNLQARHEEKLGLESDMRQMQTDIASKHTVVRSLDSQLDYARKELDKTTKDLDTLDLIERPTEKTVEQLDSEIRSSKDSTARLAVVQSRMDADRERISALLDRFPTDIPADRGAVRARINDTESKLERSRQEHDSCEQDITDCRTEESRLHSKIEMLEKSMRDLQGAGARCPVCENSLTENHVRGLTEKRVEDLRQDRAALERSRSTLESKSGEQRSIKQEIDTYTKQATDLQGLLPVLDEMDAARKNIQDMGREASELERQTRVPPGPEGAERFDDLQAYLSDIRDRLILYSESGKKADALRTEASDKEHHIKSLEDQKSKLLSGISELERDLAAKQDELDSMPDITAEISQRREQESGISEELSSLQTLLGSLSANLESLTRESERLDGQIRSAREYEKKHAELSDCRRWLEDFFIPTIRQIERQVMVSIQQDFDRTYREWFSMMIDDPTKESRVDEEFSPMVEQDGVVLPTDYFSGGEKTSVALAYRLTLNTLMRQETDSLKSNLLILDEPTDGFSKSQLHAMRPILQKLDSQQIILVSHERELESYVDNIFRIDKHNGVSSIRRM